MICIGVITFVLLALMIFLFCLGRRFDRGRCVILNQMAENDLALWQAFGRYLDDFTNIEDKMDGQPHTVKITVQSADKAVKAVKTFNVVFGNKEN